MYFDSCDGVYLFFVIGIVFEIFDVVLDCIIDSLKRILVVWRGWGIVVWEIYIYGEGIVEIVENDLWVGI